jgi:hypothetical protein
MTESERPKASPTRTSELPRWIVLILIAGVVLYSGSFAVGLMTPGRDTFRVPPKTAAYLPPPSATADTRLVEASTSAHVVAVPPPSSPSREAALNPPKDTSSQDSNKFSTASDLATLPATNPPQDADLNTQKNVASRDAGFRDTGSQESDSISTTSALAREARPRNPQQGASVSSPNATAQDSSLPPATLGFAPASTPRDRPVKTTQNLPLTDPVAAPKRQAPSESSRKMWYK